MLDPLAALPTGSPAALPLAAALVLLTAAAFPALLWRRGQPALAAVLAGGWVALALQPAGEGGRPLAAAAVAWAVGLVAVLRTPRPAPPAGEPGDLERLRLLEAALAATADGVLVAAPGDAAESDLRIEYANPAFERLTGLAAADAVGQSPSVLAADAPESLAAVRGAFRGAGPTRIEVPARRPDGGAGWAEWDIVPVPAPDGGPAWRVAVLRDTTARRRAQDELARARDFLTALLEHVPFPVAVADATDRFRLVNPAWERATGVSRELALGAAPGDVLPGPAAETVKARNAGVRETGRPLRGDREADGPDGRRAFLTVGFPLPGPDGAAGLVGEVAVDLTHQKRAEHAARETNAELRRRVEEVEALIELTPVGIAVANDPDGRAVDVNRVLRDMLGLPAVVDVEMTPAPDRLRIRARRNGRDVPPDDLPMFQCLRRGEPVDGVELRIALPGGGERVVVNSARPLFDDAGRVRGCVSVYTDLTDRIRAEAALRESEERFRRVFEDSPLGIYRADPTGRVVMANPAARRMVGGLTELPQAGWLPPGGDAPARADAPTGSELSWQTPDGRTVWVREHVRAVRDAAGGVLYYEGTLEDVTDRKRAEDALREREALLRNVIAHIPVGVFWKDRDSAFLGCNDRFARDHGFAGPDELIGLTDRDLPFTPGEAAEHVACDRQVVESGQPVLNLEETRTRADGGRSDRLVSKVPLVSPDGAVTGVLGVYQDITDRKRLEEQFRQAQKMEAVGRLAGGVAHDFNNLLTVINGNTELLRVLPPGDPDGPGLLEDIAGAGERAAKLVRQLLTFSRRQPVRPEVLDLNEVVGGLAGFLRRLIGERVKVVPRVGVGPAAVRMDRGQLEQVLVNLAVNARDAMPDGGTLTIGVAADPATAFDRRAYLEVTDSGCGMTPEVKDRLFEPFFTTKGPDKGTGLGLAVVHGIVQQAGGRVRVESAEGVGTTFRIDLPWCDDPQTSRLTPSPARAAAPGKSAGRPLTVLLVEDEGAVRKYARVALEGQGYAVTEAGDGEAALAWLKWGGAPDVVVTDLRMPGIDGRELARRVRQNHPTVGVVVASGQAPDDVLDGLPGGQFLPKPYQPGDLLRAARKALAARPAGVSTRTPLPVG